VPLPEPKTETPAAFRVQVRNGSDWVDVQSFPTREAAEAFAKGITDTKTRIEERTA
jgi:hypothetical protein